MTTLNSPDVAPSVVTDMTAKNSDSKGEAGQRLLHDEAVSAGRRASKLPTILISPGLGMSSRRSKTSWIKK